MKTKICTKCGIEKIIAEFHKAKNGKFGYRAVCKQCCKKWKIKNSKILKEKNKEYYLKNKDKIYEANKKWRKENKKKLQAYYKKYQFENHNILKKYKLNYYYLNKNNIGFKLGLNLRHRIYMALKKNIKSLSTMFLIGCEIDYLMYHLQEQFQDGMTWDNYGEWHIDHIRPCASFDLSKPEEQLKCFHYTNLQPLWAEDNLKNLDKNP